MAVSQSTGLAVKTWPLISTILLSTVSNNSDQLQDIIWNYVACVLIYLTTFKKS